MDLTSKKNIRALLKKCPLFIHSQIRPSKKLGQNFLINKKVLQKIIGAANLQKNDIVLEIGPGIGTLTKELAKKVKKVIAVEKDQKMIEILKETLKDFKNVEIINKDILKINVSSATLRGVPRFARSSRLFTRPSFLRKFGRARASGFKLIANIPYYITSPLIRKFLESKNPPKEIILMVQKEVAQRICSKPPNMSLLSVSVQFYAKAKIISYVSKKSFWPSPKVDSAIIKIVPRRFRVSVSCRFREQFFRIAKAGFSQPRKQLANNLSKGLKLNKEQVKLWLLKNNIKPVQRAETLDINNWIKLTKSF